MRPGQGTRRPLRNERELKRTVADAREPEKIARLLKTIHNRLGHRIAFAVEDAKIALSDEDATAIALAFIEAGLTDPATRSGFDGAIHAKTDNLTRVAASCIAASGLKPDAIQTIFFTGGSSRVPAVRTAIAKAAPSARAAVGADFLSVALGLTRDAERRFG